MKWFDYIILGINIICLVASIIGAIKSNLSYRKIHNLENYNKYQSCEKCCDEIEKNLFSINKFAKSRIKKGQPNPLGPHIQTINDEILNIKKICLKNDFENIRESLEDIQAKVNQLLQDSNNSIINDVIMNIDATIINEITKKMNFMREIFKEKYQEIQINNE